MSPRFHHLTTLVLSALMVLIGLALVVRALAAGGGPVAQGVLLGALFAAVGGGRIWLLLRRDA